MPIRVGTRPNYGSGRRVRADGYIELWRPGHPLARRDGYIFEHRLVAYEAGLLIDPELQVHHRNEDRADNRLENLQIMDCAGHAVLHHPPQSDSLRGHWRELQEAAATHCGLCGVRLTAKRSDARFCSDRCRITAWKRQQR